jgi:hypothetical protein
VLCGVCGINDVLKRVEKMEFRFFFPLLVSSDDWIPKSMRDEYEYSYNRMKNSFLEKIEGSVASPETRSDSYYVGGDSVGVKLRVRYK